MQPVCSRLLADPRVRGHRGADRPGDGCRLLLAAHQKPYAAKLSAYECGFEAFDDARRRFDVRFYLVAILFIIFDLEVAFLFPWAVSLSRIGLLGFFSMLGFLGGPDGRLHL